MHTASNKREQRRERSLSGFTRKVINPQGEIVFEVSVDGSHWIEITAVANALIQNAEKIELIAESDAA